MNVVIICRNKSGITTRSSPGITKRIPIKHSNKPKRIMKVSNDMKLIVRSKRLWTKGLAGDMPMTFSAPNQKKITNKPKRATGTAMRLKK